jgi:large repetitive protein
MRRCALTALVLLAACSDYEINTKDDDNAGVSDTAEPVVEDDTGQTDGSDGDDGTGEGSGTVEVPATEPIYINEGSTLWSWDPEGDLVQVGAFSSVDRMTDIAIDPAGQLWGCTFDSLYTIDPETAETVWVADIDESLHGLTFVSDGRMVGAGDGVWLIDPTTGSFTATLVEPGPYSTSGDIVGLPDGLLYWTVWGADYGEPDRLVVVDPDGGTGMRGEVEVDRVFGLGFAYGDLYGFTDAGDWVEINVDLGGLRRQGPLAGNDGWWGATTNPVLWD